MLDNEPKSELSFDHIFEDFRYSEITPGDQNKTHFLTVLLINKVQSEIKKHGSPEMRDLIEKYELLIGDPNILSLNFHSITNDYNKALTKLLSDLNLTSLDYILELFMHSYPELSMEPAMQPALVSIFLTPKLGIDQKLIYGDRVKNYFLFTGAFIHTNILNKIDNLDSRKEIIRVICKYSSFIIDFYNLQKAVGNQEVNSGMLDEIYRLIKFRASRYAQFILGEVQTLIPEDPRSVWDLKSLYLRSGHTHN